MIYGKKMTMLNALCIVGLSGSATFSSAMDKSDKLVVADKKKSDGVIKRSDNLFIPTATHRFEEAKAAKQPHLTPLKDYIEKSERSEQKQTGLQVIPFKKPQSVLYPSDDETSGDERSDESYESLTKKRKLTQAQLNKRNETRIFNSEKKEEAKTAVLIEDFNKAKAVIDLVDAGKDEDFFITETPEQAKKEQAIAERARREQVRKERAIAEQARKEQARKEQARKERAIAEQARKEQARKDRKRAEDSVRPTAPVAPIFQLPINTDIYMDGGGQFSDTDSTDATVATPKAKQPTSSLMSTRTTPATRNNPESSLRIDGRNATMTTHPQYTDNLLKDKSTRKLLGIEPKKDS